MPYIKTIYLNDEVIRLTEGMNNFSGFVNDLIIDYFKQKSFEKDIDQEIDKFRSKAEKIVNGLKEEENKLLYQKEQTKQIEETERLTEQQRQEKEKKFIKNIIVNAKELFNADITEDNAKEYRDNDYANLLDYLIEKKLVDGGKYK